jgi:chromosome segregation ATPase
VTLEQWLAAATILATFLAIFIATLYREIRKTGDRANATSADLATVRSEMDALKKDNDGLRADLRSERDALERVSHERDELKSDLRLLKERVDALVALGAKQDELIRSTQIENAMLRGRLDEQRQNYGDQISRLEKRVLDLTDALTAKAQREAQLSSELDSTRSELKTTRADLAASRTEVNTLKSQVATLETQSEGFKREIERLQTDHMDKTKPIKPEPMTIEGAST